MLNNDSMYKRCALTTVSSEWRDIHVAPKVRAWNSQTQGYGGSKCVIVKYTVRFFMTGLCPSMSPYLNFCIEQEHGLFSALIVQNKHSSGMKQAHACHGTLESRNLNQATNFTGDWHLPFRDSFWRCNRSDLNTQCFVNKGCCIIALFVVGLYDSLLYSGTKIARWIVLMQMAEMKAQTYRQAVPRYSEIITCYSAVYTPFSASPKRKMAWIAERTMVRAFWKKTWRPVNRTTKL